MPIVNAPKVTNNGGMETKVIVIKPVLDRTAGQNNGGYENRVVQEVGTH